MADQNVVEKLEIIVGCYYHLKPSKLNPSKEIVRVKNISGDNVDVISLGYATKFVNKNELEGIPLDEWVISNTRFKEINNYQWCYTYETSGITEDIILTTRTSYMTIDPPDSDISYLNYLHQLQTVFKNRTKKNLELRFLL